MFDGAEGHHQGTVTLLLNSDKLRTPIPTPSLSFFIYKPCGWLPKWLEALGGNEAHGSHTAPGT